MVDALVSPQLSASNTTQVSTQAAQGTALNSDFETFLKMLTAQAKYQDPLDPIDSAEYASQLAQFSSVEQSVRTNELLQQVASQLGSHDLTSLATWIGKQVRNSSPVSFSGSPLSLTFASVEGATDAELIALDSSGKEVQRIEIDPEVEAFTWAGRSNSGTPLLDGQYSFRVEHYSGSTKLSALPVYNYSRITELSVEGDETRFILNNGGSVTLGDVVSVREDNEG